MQNAKIFKVFLSKMQNLLPSWEHLETLLGLFFYSWGQNPKMKKIKKYTMPSIKEVQSRTTRFIALQVTASSLAAVIRSKVGEEQKALSEQSQLGVGCHRQNTPISEGINFTCFFGYTVQPFSLVRVQRLAVLILLRLLLSWTRQ
jgi:hypothetical protein